MNLARTRRLQRLEQKMRPALKTYILIHEIGSEQYTLDGATLLSAEVDRLALVGNLVIIHDIPTGYLG